MDYSYIAVFLAILGLGLVVAEIFIPSGGMIMIGSIVCFAASVWCGWEAWGETPLYFWTYIGSLVMLLPLAVVGAFYVLPRTEFGRRIFLEAPSLEKVTPYGDEEAYLTQLIGQRGKTLSMLNPGGLVLVNHERMHCEGQGLMIDADTDVEVVGVRGNRLVVRVPSEAPSGIENVDSVVDSSSPAETSALQTERAEGSSGNSDEQPLDFDIPQG